MQYNPEAQEFNPRPSNAGGSEFQGAPEAPSPAPSAKKKKPLQLKLTSFLVSATAVAVVGGTAIAPMFSPEASITSLSATDTQIVYSVEVEEGAHGLMLVAYNDFTRREVALTEGVNEGTFEGLKPQMRYTVAVEASGLGGTLAEERVTTLSAEEAPVTALYAVSHECTCNVDGMTGIVIGLTLTLVHLLGIRLTGTSVNPARSIGPALLQMIGGDFTAISQIWIFIAGPLAGAALAALLYRFFESKKQASAQENAE